MRVMPVLERACFFATWCSAAGLGVAALVLAAGPLIGHRHVPQTQC